MSSISSHYRRVCPKNSFVLLHRVLTLGVAIGHVGMNQDDLVQNIHLAVNFLVSLLKKVCPSPALAHTLSVLVASRIQCVIFYMCSPSRTGRTSALCTSSPPWDLPSVSTKQPLSLRVNTKSMLLALLALCLIGSGSLARRE
jgi:hypothetical protein